MKICFLEAANSISKFNIDAHVRQAVMIVDNLRKKGHTCYLLDGQSMASFKEKNIDVIVKSYAAFYENVKDECRIINENQNAKLFWLTNEYDLAIGGSFQKIAKKRPFAIIANYKNKSAIFSKSFCVNTNSLFFERKEVRKKIYNICYYGTYRKNRAIYFKKYISHKNFILSTSKKNFKKFASLGCDFTAADAFNWSGKYNTLGYFKYSLYIEDIVTHTLFNNLADRFYEALSNETVSLFDRSCINTLRKSEIANLDWHDFIIDSYDDITNRDYEEDIKRQKLWIPVIEQERTKVLEEIERIITQE